ncbi:hypothetical protein ACFFHH_19240, partial [Cytobacillus solani]|uniref:hypothetical protein n=1 Tax=Cytobacillus solani TaxID=1637975 RepID=UPI0035EE901F
SVRGEEYNLPRGREVPFYSTSSIRTVKKRANFFYEDGMPNYKLRSHFAIFLNGFFLFVTK